jgi:hypothetical protein
MRLDPVFLKAWVFAEFMRRIVMNFNQGDGEDLTLWVRDDPAAFFFGDAIWGVHPIHWFVGATIGMNGHTPVCLHHDEASRQRKVSRQSAGVIDGTSGDDKTHEVVIVGVAS